MDKLKDVAKTLKPQFGGVHVHVRATDDSRLLVSVEAEGSVDLPGELDQIVAQVVNLWPGLGNSPAPSPSSEG